jgi:hypothetical protein
MPKRIKISLSEAETQQLQRWAQKAAKPYMRERARAILRVAGGEPVSKVAETLRTRVHRNAVGEWVKRFVAERCAGLKIRQGRGRKAAFSPTEPSGGPNPT